jgi:hypothetical protein
MSEKKLKYCANGCGVPPDLPSLVICKKCQDKITKTLKDLLKKMESKEQSDE